jgi:AcrR family transcriptional regulator
MSRMKRENDDKKERVLKAAQECFTSYGLKRTSMEDIAQKAAISRAALYLLFPDKKAIFRTLSECLHEESLTRAETALQGKEPITERLVAAFEGKHLELMEIVMGSAHGVEIAELSHDIGADIAEKVEIRFREILTEALEAANSRGELRLERVKLDAEECAELLRLAVEGLKRSGNLALFRQQLAQLIRVFTVATGPTTI